MMVSDYRLVRSPTDQHVMTSYHDRAAMISSLVARAASASEMLELIERLTPDAAAIDEVKPTAAAPIRMPLPSEKLYDAIGMERLTAFAQRHAVYLPMAVSHVVADAEMRPRGTELLAVIPSDDIHRMQRGADWIGDFYSADLMVRVLSSLNASIDPGHRVLDLGCSSGSLVRVLAWAYPGADFIGCDPVRSSIAWAKANLPFVNAVFMDQNQSPPLDIASASIDRMSAISIFSHHGFAAATAWFEESARVLKSGGLFFFTTHGLGAIHSIVKHDLFPVERYREMYSAFLTTGYVFQEAWLGVDDAGNSATEAEWGNSFFNASVVAVMVAPWFDVLHFGRRMNQGVQDTYVLRRR